MIREWKIVQSKAAQDFRIFKARWDTAVSPRTNKQHELVILDGPNWVNVVAVTPKQEVVLIEQYRHGTRAVTLEIPGGMVSRKEDPADAGVRELREETGFSGDAPEVLGVVHPNPAFQNNICHSILVPNARKVGEPEFDSGEDIEVHLVPLRDISEMIRDGRIPHSLVILAFYWMTLRGKL